MSIAKASIQNRPDTDTLSEEPFDDGCPIWERDVDLNERGGGGSFKFKHLVLEVVVVLSSWKRKDIEDKGIKVCLIGLSAYVADPSIIHHSRQPSHDGSVLVAEPRAVWVVSSQSSDAGIFDASIYCNPSQKTMTVGRGFGGLSGGENFVGR